MVTALLVNDNGDLELPPRPRRRLRLRGRLGGGRRPVIPPTVPIELGRSRLIL